jgi:hypothetical protein
MFLSIGLSPLVVSKTPICLPERITISQSPFLIDGDGVDPAKQTLNIDRGNEIGFKIRENHPTSSNSNNLLARSFQIEGTLFANGSLSESIRLTHDENSGNVKNISTIINNVFDIFNYEICAV